MNKTKTLIMWGIVIAVVVVVVMMGRQMQQQQGAATQTAGGGMASAEHEASGADAGPDGSARMDTLDFDLEAALSERAMGDENAPIVVYEFSSLTCPHCAAFHNDVLPEIKKNYIDTGKVRWVIRDFPLDAGAMQATLLLRCAPKQRYFDLLDALFAGQKIWKHAQKIPVALAEIGIKYGLSPKQYESCLGHETLGREILTTMRNDGQKWHITATPTFVINDGVENIRGGRPYDEFAKILDRLLVK